MKFELAVGMIEPSAAHGKLEVFVGKWHAEGTSYGEGSDGVPWTSEESYEWLPGGFFLLHRWDAMTGERAFQGTEILGYDEAEGGYFTRFFDNSGFHPEYRATVDGDVWRFEEPETRATVTVEDEGNRMRFKWEWRNGGPEWVPLCDRVATKV